MERDMLITLNLLGKDVHLLDEEEFEDGLKAAMNAFARHNADPQACAAANDKLVRDELLSREEAMMCVVWDEADTAAFQAATLGWLRRDVDIYLGVD
jgi:hypothetical protein